MTTEPRQTGKTAHDYELKKRRYSIAAIILLVLGVLFSLAIWQITRQAINTSERSRFEHYSEMIRTLIVERVDEYVAALRGLRAFIDSSENVTREEWQTYINDLDITRHFKGCLGFSFIRYVPRHQLESFLDENRSGATDFSVVTTGSKPALFVVEMIEPLARNRELLGYDLAQEDALFEVMEDTAVSGRAGLSSATRLVEDGANPPGVLLLLPVYKHSTQFDPHGHSWKDLRGWVGVSILVSEMVAGIDTYFNSPLDVEILDVNHGTESAALFDADGRLHSIAREAHIDVDGYVMVNKNRIDIVNRSWVLNVYALPGFSEQITHNMPEILLLAGVLLSLLGAWQVASYGRPLERAQALAEKMTRELRVSEERFHKMFQEHNAVMLLVDPDSREIVDANAAACNFYGYAREQLISLPIGRINALSAHETKDTIRQIRERRKSHFEIRHTLASGAVRDVEVYTSPIIVDGHPLIFSIIHDITERKHAENELVKYRENLESLVQEKTHKLEEAHSELLQQDRLATLGKLTATVSHELRNPLGTIKTALFSIEDSFERKDIDKALRPLELAERSINRCVAIIEELNSFARVKELRVSEAALDDWLKDLVEEQNIPAGISCELNLSIKDKVPFDQEKLRQVVVNLISNAIHALQEKGPEKSILKISTRLLERQYEISIGDNGIGMTDEVKENIFEPLYSTKGFGVGLGMVVVKKIVEQHQGEIIIESQEGGGTTVMIRLPLNLSR